MTKKKAILETTNTLAHDPNAPQERRVENRGRPKKHDWASLKEDFITAKLIDPAFNLAMFAIEQKIDYPQVRNAAGKFKWLIEYGNRRVQFDESVANKVIEQHGAVIERMRARLIFTEEHVRVKTATFTAAMRDRLEQAMLSLDVSQLSPKELREMYALMTELELQALGIVNTKHSVHHHVQHQTQGPDGVTYLSPAKHAEGFARRRMIAEKVLSVIEGQSERVPERKKRA